MNRDVHSFFDFGRELAREDNAQGFEVAMNTLIGVERQEVLDGWFEGALEGAVEAYTQALRAVPYQYRNAVIAAVGAIARQYSSSEKG